MSCVSFSFFGNTAGYQTESIFHRNKFYYEYECDKRVFRDIEEGHDFRNDDWDYEEFCGYWNSPEKKEAVMKTLERFMNKSSAENYLFNIGGKREDPLVYCHKF